MEEKTKTVLTEWSTKTGRPMAELVKQYEEYVTMFKTAIPGKTDTYYEDSARRKLFIDIKADILSPAKPYDFLLLGASGALDVNREDMEDKRALWDNPNTRAQAVMEHKVYQYNSTIEKARMTITLQGKKVDVPDGAPLDTREWMTPPKEDGSDKGRKNFNFGKALLPTDIRTIAGFGRPALGGEMKLISIMEMGDTAKIVPTLKSSVRARLNLRSEDQNRYVCNAPRNINYSPIIMAEFPVVDDAVICNLLASAPAAIHKTLAELPQYHKDNEKDARRLVIVEGDVTFIAPEKSTYGSTRIIIEDTSSLDLAAEGTTLWVPTELDVLMNFGKGSRIIAIGRTNTGPGWDRETRQQDSSVTRINLNVVGLYAIPENRVAPEEDTALVGESVK